MGTAANDLIFDPAATSILKEAETSLRHAGAATTGSRRSMGTRCILAAFFLATCVQPAVAQPSQSDVMIVAQALDRCMATYAVRLTKTAASDEQMYAEATRGCAPLNAKFIDGIKVSVPPQQAAEFLKEADASRKPNFLSMLAKIRSDRAKRSSNLPAE